MKKHYKLLISGMVLVLLCGCGLVYYLFFYDKYDVSDELLKLGYSKSSIVFMEDKNIANDVVKGKYSNVLDKAIKSGEYKSKYLKEYLVVLKGDVKTVNKLLDLGYVDEEVNTIISSVSSDRISDFIKMGYDKDIIKNIKDYDSIITLFNKGYSFNDIYKLLEMFSEDVLEKIKGTDKVRAINYSEYSYYKKENFDRYLAYDSGHKDLSLDDVITYVNIGLDRDFYTNAKGISDQDSLLVLVNKYNYLSSDYVPSDLEVIDSNYNPWGLKLRHDAREAFEKMCSDAKSNGYYVYASSTYRSYYTQNSVYNGYVSRSGRSSADTYSARAGYSEHQTGLAVDVKNDSHVYTDFGVTKEFGWMKNNSYKYGFILRYPSGKDNITGYVYESWHYRYVGVEVATYIYNNNLTFDEYMARK